MGGQLMTEMYINDTAAHRNYFAGMQGSAVVPQILILLHGPTPLTSVSKSASDLPIHKGFRVRRTHKDDQAYDWFESSSISGERSLRVPIPSSFTHGELVAVLKIQRCRWG